MIEPLPRSGSRQPAALSAAVATPSADGDLGGLRGTVAIRGGGSKLRRLVSFLGPGYLVAVGYMDPGNWATSLAAGSRFGYGLLFVAFLANLMAIVLQALAIRLGIASGRDLARACREFLPRGVNIPLWLMAEVAIIATDLAEVIGTAIGLQLLFGIPLAWGVLITSLDVVMVLALQHFGFRKIEAFIIAMLAVITLSFGAQILMADPDWGAVARGFIPDATVLTDPDRLYLALGILGATVMPHNLYLHSAIVQTRAYGPSLDQRREAINLATIDSTLALIFALGINASILILAAATFHASGRLDVTELGEAHGLLMPLLGASVAPSLFAIALIACGLNSTVTATLAGQTVMEGFVQLRFQPWIRRLVTRALAIVPAAAVTIIAGEHGTASLLILSQVILSLQLPFAVLPLVWFTADRRRLGTLTAPRWLTAIAVVIAAVIIALNGMLTWTYVVG
ncbi:divalent metal cation transporter [Siculibacillus lacustris]|uniref:Divalent metal cation transporter MntH n=1 Tax=Siculibacillus lacustris TaxID=1549641 RepID=A0A4Q9VH44_9HYPH|nr:Nramp family divalent metal transporter [Siculibacillus lacustris]TBW34416.1 divalent metal cation transporter [Siculibacillus lacustris]